MKKTQLKDAVRNIKKQIVSFVSIIMITALAVLTYLGIHYAAAALAGNGAEFFAATNFRDIEVSSTYMLTQDDLEAIRNTEGVLDVEAVYRTPGKVAGADASQEVMVVSLTERINTPMLVAGTLPDEVHECVIEQDIASRLGLAVGDNIEVLSNGNGVPQYLLDNIFTISGIVYHPDHSCSSRMSPGSRYVVVLPEAFDLETLHGSFMTAEVLVEGTSNYDLFTDEYLDYVSLTAARLDELSQVRAPIRYDEIRGEFQQSIDEAQDQLVDARAELDEHWAEYNEGRAEIDDAEAQLADLRAQLDSAAAQLADAEAQLADARAQLDDSWAQLQDARAQLDETNVRLTEAWAELEAARVQLEYYGQQIDYGRTQLEQAQAQIADGRAQLESTYMQMEDAKTTIRTNLYNAIAEVLGQDIADRIDWAPSATSVNVDDPNTNAAYFDITQTVTADLNRSLGDNIFAVISSLGIPEDELRAAYEAVRGEVLIIADDDPVIQAIVDEIVAVYTSYDNRYEEFANAARTWNDYHNMYIDGVTQYNIKYQEFEAGVAQYNSRLEQYNQGLAQYEDARVKYEAGEAQYADGLARYEAGEAEYQNRLAQYNDARSQYEAGEAQYSEGLAQLNEGKAELDEALAQLEQGEDQYREGQQQLQKAKDNRDLLKDCHWIILTPEGNVGYMQIRTDKKNVSDMGATIAFVFILVGALVIYATTGRIVDEQRKLVGATKAFGLRNREILAKYMAFGVFGTFIGTVMGIIIGYTFIQWIFLHVYGKNYVYGGGHRYFLLPLTLIIAAGAVAIAAVTVFFACTNLMRSSAITLMQDIVPYFKRKKRKAGSKINKSSLYRRMITLNMLSDKKRVIVTIISIAGCCTLLVAGMSLNFSVKHTIDLHYGNFETYDLRVRFDPSISDTVQTDLEQIMQDHNVQYIPMRYTYTSYKYDDKLNVFELFVADLDQMESYLKLRDIDTREPFTSGTDGIFIFLRLSEVMGIHRGDTITIFDAGMNPHSVGVAGVFNQYFGQYVLMSPDTYVKTFGETVTYNAFIINLNGADQGALLQDLSQVPGFMNFVDSANRKNTTKSFASVLDYISLLFIIVAAMMAYFILLNLVNMYIHQKKLELTLMRVNGFTVKEVIRYVSLELVVSTIIGIILGLALGSVLSYRMIRLLESIVLHFDRGIQFKAWIIAALFTVFFTGVISAWALRKVKTLRLTDIVDA